MYSTFTWVVVMTQGVHLTSDPDKMTGVWRSQLVTPLKSTSAGGLCFRKWSTPAIQAARALQSSAFEAGCLTTDLQAQPATGDTGPPVVAATACQAW